MAFPLAVIERSTREALFTELLAVMEREGVEVVVVGLPVEPGGGEGLTARQARNFAASLGRRVAVPIVFADESHSSTLAEAQLREAGLRGPRLKKALDAQAAAVILEGHLQRNG